jgi:hypothetical protein
MILPLIGRSALRSVFTPAGHCSPAAYSIGSCRVIPNIRGVDARPRRNRCPSPCQIAGRQPVIMGVNEGACKRIMWVVEIIALSESVLYGMVARDLLDDRGAQSETKIR